MPTHYTAVPKRNPGRSAWLVEFRHPLRNDSNNRPGRKIRKGLGTSDEAEALSLVAELNDLLSDESLWSIGAKPEAFLKYQPKVVDIFFSEIEARSNSPHLVRDSFLPLPTSESGYARAVLLGIPGAGKTTILRQLIGADPERERFPSTSVNRTTTFPLELVTAGEAFKAVVTFMSEPEVRFEIEESISAAIVEAVFGNKAQVARTFLEKSDMRFRLKYLLGAYDDGDEEEIDPYDDDPVDMEDHFFELNGSEIEKLKATVDGYVNRIIELAKRYRLAIESGQGPVESLSFEDKNAALDLIEEQAQEDEAFLELVSDVVEEVSSKFFGISSGTFHKTNSGWPRAWTIESPAQDRAEFIRLVKYFSGIAKPSWGRLLTPVVNGMRVFGPFKPTWAPEAAKLVLIDTEGLGHKANASAELPEQILPLLNSADVILLVDSAKSGMNLTAGKALEGIVNAGHSRKVSIIFTHMDAVKGDNLKGNAKYEHVFLGLRNVVENQVAKNVSAEAARFLLERLHDSTFYVGKIQDADPVPAKKELIKLFLHIAAAKPPIFVPVATPEYNPDNLVLAVQKAVSAFRRTWQGYLGVSGDPTIKPRPWQSVKALSRRYAEQFDDGFPLRPTSDLVNALSASFSQFLESPVGWNVEPTPTQRREAIDHLKATITNQLPNFSALRLKDIPHPKWVEAYSLKGTGSTFGRRMRIEELFQCVVPIPDATGNKEVSKLLGELKLIFANAIEEATTESATIK